MSIATFTELKTAVMNHAHDADLSASLADFIALAEARMNRRLRTVPQETSATGDAAATIALPDDFLEARSLTIVSGTLSRQLRPITLAEARQWTVSGESFAYAVSGTTIILAPPPNGTGPTYQLDYYARIPALSDAAPTNWLLTDWPDIYLYAALRQAAVYQHDDEAGARYEALYGEAVSALMKTDPNQRFGQPLVMRAPAHCGA